MASMSYNDDSQFSFPFLFALPGHDRCNATERTSTSLRTCRKMVPADDRLPTARSRDHEKALSAFAVHSTCIFCKNFAVLTLPADDLVDVPAG